MKTLFYLLIISFFVYSCELNSLEEDVNRSNPNSRTKYELPNITLSEEEVNDENLLDGNQIYKRSIEKSDISEFRWENSNNHVLWSAISLSNDSSVSVGYKLGYNISSLLEVRQTILRYILNESKKLNIKLKEEDIIISDYQNISAFIIKIPHIKILAKLRKLDIIRYIEPWGFTLEPFYKNATSISGRVEAFLACENDTYHTSSFTYYPGYNSKISWHLNKHNIVNAWNLANGSGVTVGIIDTGIATQQELLNSLYSTGISNNRQATIINDGIVSCWHGTSIAGMISSPVNNQASATGVAWKANIFSREVSDDVFLETAVEKQSLIDKIYAFAYDPNVKLVNASVGFYIYSQLIKDVIQFYVDQGKILMCAGGSFLEIYPGKYGNTISAVGVEWDNTDPNGINLNSFGINNPGPHIDFSVYLKKKGTSDYALGIHKDLPHTISAEASSAASATMTGIIALMLEVDNSLNQNEVYNILKQSASIYQTYGTQDLHHGWGIVDAYAAVSKAINYNYLVDINGPQFIYQPGSYNWSPIVSGVSGTISSYRWYYNNQLVSINNSYSRTFNSIGEIGYNNLLKLEVRTTSGQFKSKEIYVGYPPI